MALLLFSVVAVLVLQGCTGTGQFKAKGWSGLTASEQELYFAAGDGRVAALDRQDGKVMWTFPAKGGLPVNAVYGKPALLSDKVYVGDYAGNVFALNRSTGTSIWMRAVKLPDQEKASPIVGGLAISGDTLLVASEDGHLYALDANDNAERWRFPKQGAMGKVWSTPSVSNGVVFFGSLDHTIFAVDLATGAEKWRRTTEGAVSGQALIHDGLVYVGSFDRTMYALDAATGEVRWKAAGDNWFWAGPTTDGRSLYAGTVGGSLYAFDLKTGALQWQIKTKAAIVTPVVPVGDRLAVVTEDGKFRAFQASNGQEQWVLDLEERVRSQPVIAGSDGVVYLTDLKFRVRALNALRGTIGWIQQLPES
jgi:outer membrane protein assembly factor BamB